MVSLEVIAILLSGISISASLFYYANVLQNQNQTRQAQHFMDLYNVYRTTEFKNIYTDILFNWKWANYEDWWNKYGAENNPQAFSDWNSIAGYCDGIGVLLKKKFIDISMVDELLANTIIPLWEKMGPNIQQARANGKGNWQAPLPDLHSNFEYLFEELVKYREKQ